MYKQENEIFEQIRSFHKRLSELYSNLTEKAENQRVKMLLDYLSRHEKLREEFIIKYEKIAPEKEMNRWIRKPSDNLSNQICKCFENMKSLSSYSFEEIVNIALHFDNCLVKLYEILASEEETSVNDPNIFYYMLKKTKQQEMNLSRDVNWLYDL